MHKFAFLNHKCGTVYFNSVLVQSCKKSKIEFVQVQQPLKNIESTVSFVKEQLIVKRQKRFNAFLKKSENEKLFFFANSIYQFPDLISQEEYRAFMMIRDPRDVIISGYFSHKNSHPINDWKDLENIREKLNELSLNEGIKYEINRGYSLRNFKTIEFNNPKIKVVRFEDFINDNLQIVSDIFNFLEIKLEPNIFETIINNNSFERKSLGRLPGEENVNHHFRKGIAGDWKNYFTPEHRRVFNEKWGDLLISLGYEEDDSWV